MSQRVTRDMTHVISGNGSHLFIFDLWSSSSMWHLKMADSHLLSLIFNLLPPSDTWKWHTYLMSHTLPSWKFWTSYTRQQLPKAKLTITSFEDFWSQKCCQFFLAKIFVDEENEEGDCPSQPPIKCKILPERQQRPPWTGELERKLVLPESDFMTRLHKSRPLQPFLAKTGRLTILANNRTCSGN